MKRVFLLFVTLSMLLVMLGCKAQPLFEVDDFDLEHEKGEYSETYKGAGEIKTDAKGIYLVYVKSERKRGGATSYEKEEVHTVIVEDGEGTFSTYDSSYGVEEGEEFKEPKYEFEIIGYQQVTEIKG